MPWDTPIGDSEFGKVVLSTLTTGAKLGYESHQLANNIACIEVSNGGFAQYFLVVPGCLHLHVRLNIQVDPLIFTVLEIWIIGVLGVLPRL